MHIDPIPESAAEHAELTAQYVALHREIMKLRLEMDEVSKLREHAALRFCGADIGGTVKLTGARYKGTLATIEDAVIWNPGCAPVKLGEKPTILVSIHGSGKKHPVKISGQLWELPGQSD